MSEVFFIADLHFDHRKMVNPDPESGEIYRPWDTREEMNEALVELWNETVSTKDRVFLLGDLAINRSGLTFLPRLNGKITLVMGNHETFRTEEYAKHVHELRGAVEYENLILTHIPVHPSQIGRWKGNVHGHLHKQSLEEPGYVCVSAEQVGYRPATLAEVLTRLETAR